MLSLTQKFLFVLACLGLAQTLNAQPMRQPEKPQPPEILQYEPQSEGFKKAISDFKEQMKAMHNAQIRYHNSESTADESRYKQQWFELRESIHSLHINIMNAALAEFLTNTESNAALGRIIFKSLKRNAEKDNFEGMLPVAKAMVEINYPEPDMQQIYLQFCLANNEFELARQSVIAANYPAETLDQLLKQLDVFTKNWDEELKARERDAIGEPLPQAKIFTSKGEVIVELFENEAPEAVASFISLAEKGFYDYSDFFMVIEHSAAQVGCPNEDGSGGPGYMLEDEYAKPNARKLFRGSLVLATLRDKPNSGGSQFFIPFLPTVDAPQNTVFGRVISGMQNVANLNRIDPHKKKDEDKAEQEDPKLPPDEIIRIEIIRKRTRPYEPDSRN